MSDLPAETKPASLAGSMEPLPIPIPQPTSSSSLAHTFQSSLYFGSPGSPSQNPFSFASPNGPATTSAMQAFEAPSVQPGATLRPSPGAQTFKSQPEAPSAMDSLQGHFVTEQPREQHVQPSFLPAPVTSFSVTTTVPSHPAGSTPLTTSLQQHFAEAPLSHAEAPHGSTLPLVSALPTTGMRDQEHPLPQTVESFSAQNGHIFQQQQQQVKATITASHAPLMGMSVPIGGDDETTPLLAFTPSSSQETVDQQSPQVNQLKGTAPAVCGVTSDIQSTEQPLSNPKERDGDLVTSSLEQTSSLPVHPPNEGYHSSAQSPVEAPVSLPSYPSGHSSPLQPELPLDSRSSLTECRPPPPPPPPRGSRASSTLSTGSSTPRQSLTSSYQTSGPQSVPETLMGVNSALTQQLTNAFTSRPTLPYQHPYSNANIPLQVNFSQGFPLLEHSRVSEELQALVPPMSNEIKPPDYSHMSRENGGWTAETSNALTHPPSLEQQLSDGVQDAGEVGSQPASSPTQSVSSLLDGADENIAIQSPFKLVPPTEISPLPHPMAGNTSEVAAGSPTELSTVKAGSGERPDSTEQPLPVAIETLSSVTSSTAHSSDTRGQMPSLLPSQLHNSYPPPIFSHPGENQEPASLLPTATSAVITPATHSSQIPHLPVQLGTSRPPELSAPEGSAEPVLDLHLGQPSTVQLFTGPPPPPPPQQSSTSLHTSGPVSAPPISTSRPSLPNMDSLSGQPQPRPHTTADGKDQSHSPPPTLPVGAVSLPSVLPGNPLSIQRGSHPSAFSPPPLVNANAELPTAQTFPSAVPPPSLPASAKSSTGPPASSLPSSGPTNNPLAVPSMQVPSSQPSNAAPPLPPHQHHQEVSEEPGYQDRRPAGMEREGQGPNRPGYYHGEDDTYDSRHYPGAHHDQGERYPTDYYEYHQPYPYDDHRPYYPQRQFAYDPYEDQRPYFPHNRPVYDHHDNHRSYYHHNRPAYDPRYNYRGGREAYHYQSYHHDPYYDQRGYYHGGARGQRSDRHYYEWQDHSRSAYYDERDVGYHGDQYWEDQDYHRQENMSWYPEDQQGGYGYDGHHHHHPPTTSHDHQYSTREDISLADTSAIHGRPDQLLDPTQSYYNSPSVAYSRPDGHGYDAEVPYESTRLEQPGIIDYGGYSHPADERGYGQQNTTQPEGVYMYGERVEEPWQPITEGTHTNTIHTVQYILYNTYCTIQCTSTHNVG